MHINDDKAKLAIARIATADRLLMHSLMTSHGPEFAAVFRIEYAEEVARAIWLAAQRAGVLPASDTELE